MQNYDLNRLGDKDFETLVQTLLKHIIGAGTITFGDGPDGAREATFSGKAPYPSANETWEGYWIFQVKFHDLTRIGPDKARQSVLKDLKSELDKVVNKYHYPCDNYILITNVPLSSVPGTGTHDQIATAIIPEFLTAIPHIHIWGYDDIARFLEAYPDVRTPYFHLLTPGDLIAELMAEFGAKQTELATTLQMYLRVCFDNEQYAQLDQAGEVDAKQLQLKSVFIDLDIHARSEDDLSAFFAGHPECSDDFQQLEDEERSSACKLLLASNLPKAVLVGGPGQGKSTLCQFLAQIHRAYLLQRNHELKWNDSTFVPLQIRVPLRIILKDYAQWISGSEGAASLESFIALQIRERTARNVSTEQIQELTSKNPVLLILDGLDEVTDRELRQQMLGHVGDFLARAEVLKADFQIICTSRPTGYTDQFDPGQFLHLKLAALDREKIVEYTTKWIEAKKLETHKSKSLLASISDCLSDPNFSSLMNTPLQVTIFIFIILSGGTPPRQREELFNEYLEVIYKRERSKSKAIIQTEKQLLFGLHQYLGYLLHRRAASADTRSKMTEDEFRQAVLEYLCHEDPYSSGKDLESKAEHIIQEAHERLVLLVQPEDGYFGFELRSIQEFFAAGYLVDTSADNEQRFERFQSVSIPPHWRNVALFFAGRVGRSNRGECAHVLETCREIDRHKPDFFLRRGAWLAMDIAVDRSFGPVKPLQRSAIEIALTLLDSDFPPDGRSELISRLRQLPEADLKQHVLPLLQDRIQKIRLEDGFCTADVYCELTPDRVPIEQFFAAELPDSPRPRSLLLRKAIQYRLSPALAASFVEAGHAEAYLTGFVSDPAYIIEILRCAEIDPNIAFELSCRAVEEHFFAGFVDLPSLEIPDSPYGRAVLSWRLFCLAENFRRFRARPHKSSAFDINPEQLSALIGILGLPGVEAVLKASAWVVAIWVIIVRNYEEGLLECSRVIREMKEDERMGIDHVLQRLNYPSFELIVTGEVADLTLFMSAKMLRSVRFVHRPIMNARNATQIIAWALDTMALKKSIAVTLALRRDSKIRKQPEDPAEELIKFRLAARMGELWPRLPSELPSKTLSILLSGLCSGIADHDPGSWESLRRLTHFKWPVVADGSLLKSLNALCIALEKSNTLLASLGISGAITRVAEMKGAERYVTWLLDIIQRANHISGTAFHARDIKKSTITKIANIAVESSKLPGFVVWFQTLDTSLRPRRDRPVEVPKLNINTARLIELTQSKNQGIARGAVLVFANMLTGAYEEAADILKRAPVGGLETDDCWAELIEGTVRAAEDPGAIDFLERVLSAGSGYVRAVKHAAFGKYEGVARNSTIDIVQQESQLGLPLQDVLKLSTKAARTAK